MAETGSRELDRGLSVRNLEGLLVSCPCNHKEWPSSDKPNWSDDGFVLALSCSGHHHTPERMDGIGLSLQKPPGHV